MQERYYEYMLRRIKEENMTEEWERSFLPLDDPRAVPPPSYDGDAPHAPERLTVRCAYCGQEHSAYMSFPKHVHTRLTEHVFMYCSSKHREDDYMQRLRRTGL